MIFLVCTDTWQSTSEQIDREELGSEGNVACLYWPAWYLDVVVSAVAHVREENLEKFRNARRKMS